MGVASHPPEPPSSMTPALGQAGGAGDPNRGETEAETRGRCRQLPDPGRDEPGSTGRASGPRGAADFPPRCRDGDPRGVGGGTHDTQGRHRGTRGYPHPSLPPAPFPQQLICNVNEGVRPCKITDGNEPPLPGVGGATLQRGPVGGGHPWVGVQAYPEVLGEVGHLGVGGGDTDGDVGTHSSAPGTLGTHLALTGVGGWVCGGVLGRDPHTHPTPAPCTGIYRFLPAKRSPVAMETAGSPVPAATVAPSSRCTCTPGGGGGAEGPGGAAGAALGPDTRYAAK